MPRSPKRRKIFFQTPWFAAAFIFFLAVVQLNALQAQFRYGFRLLASDPFRIPFSWDMFSNRVERCAMQWEPALPGVPPLSSLRELGTRLEWDVVFDRVEVYRFVGEWVCRLHGPIPAQIHLNCVLPDGSHIQDEIHCGKT